MKRRRRKIKPYKISRGSFEEQKLREDKKTETQRALLFILPVVMLAVLAVGIFFGYKSYEKSAAEEKTVISGSEPTEPVASDPMLLQVVSPAYPLDATYVPSLTEYNGVKVSPVMTDDLTKLLSDAEAAGHPVCGGLEELRQLRLGAVAADVGDRDLADLAADRVRNEDRTAVDPADAQALRGITGDLHRCFLTDFQHNWLLLFHVKQFLCAVPSAHPVFPNYTTNAVGSPYCIFEPCVVQWRRF